tara:strand:- start:845 stop:1783 length:939 start_codon:yes stop_codon:yes gene_type:complete
VTTSHDSEARGEKSPLAKLFTDLKIVLIFIALLILCIGAGYAWSHINASEKYELLLKEKTAVIEELNISKNRTINLSELLEGEAQEAEELRAIIKSLEAREPEIEYVVKTETVIKKSKPKIIELEKCKAPPEYVYLLENGLPVARFKAHTNEEEGKVTYTHETADIAFENSIVITDEETAVMTKVKSSLKPGKQYLVRTDKVQTKKIKDFKTFEPHLMISLGGSLELTPIGGDLTANISMPLFHITDREWDLLAPKIGFNNNSFRVGVDVVSYNLGKELPIITDLWLSLGTSIDLLNGSKYPSLDLSIGSKF